MGLTIIVPLIACLLGPAGQHAEPIQRQPPAKSRHQGRTIRPHVIPSPPPALPARDGEISLPR